jgi:NAD(P)-dependent dehydrogenase (short-subunit alcohol dehydrogenase family)
MFRLDDSVIVVVGAGGGGMGTQTARIAAELGATVVCVDRDEAAVADLARELGAQMWVGDVTSPASVARLISDVDKRFGRADGLVDIVGGSRFTRIPELDVDEWHQQFDLNLTHAFLLGKSFGDYMRRRSTAGSMVFITSIAALFGSRTHPAYSAAKAGLVSWVRSLAEEYGPDGIRANSIAPGATLTERMDSLWSEAGQASMAEPTVLGRIGTSDEIAGPVAFLLSRAAGNVTGQTIVVDGGASIKDPVYGSGRNVGGAEIRRRHHPEAVGHEA